MGEGIYGLEGLGWEGCWMAVVLGGWGWGKPTTNSMRIPSPSALNRTSLTFSWETL